ncbi:MAG: DUF4124 domain-containing protein [Nitrospirota bacterium]
MTAWLGLALWGWYGGFLTPALAADYYSWIDTSGTIVLTDDLTHLPPATKRSQVSVHRFPDRPPAPAESEETAAQPPAPPGGKQETEARSAPDGREAGQDLPNVTLDQPEEGARTQYVWVPLASPVYLTGRPVQGFWSRRSVQSPEEALRAHLVQQRQWSLLEMLTKAGLLPQGRQGRRPHAPMVAEAGGGQKHPHVIPQQSALTNSRIVAASRSSTGRSIGRQR